MKSVRWVTCYSDDLHEQGPRLLISPDGTKPMPEISASLQRLRDVDLSTRLDLREDILQVRGGNRSASPLVRTTHKTSSRISGWQISGTQVYSGQCSGVDAWGRRLCGSTLRLHGPL